VSDQWVRPPRRCWMAKRGCERAPLYTFNHGLLGLGVTCEEHTKQLDLIHGGYDLLPFREDAPRIAAVTERSARLERRLAALTSQPLMSQDAVDANTEAIRATEAALAPGIGERSREAGKPESTPGAQASYTECDKC